MITIEKIIPDSAYITVKYVSGITLNTGTLDSGAVADTQTANGDYYVVNEIASTPGFDIEFDFATATTEQDIVRFWGRYAGGNNHEVEAQIYNWETTSWDDLRASTLDIPDTTEDIYKEWLISGTKSDYAHATNGHKIRFYHTSAGTAAHDMLIDKICIEG